ncbi:MAG: nucleotidyltransferase family protein [Pseudomonadota bacterium]
MIPPAMIFAAGFGTRMGALTQRTPKPLLTLDGTPMINHAIDLLRSVGVTKIYANTHYLAEQLEGHLRTNRVTPLREDPILETGGGLRAAADHLEASPVITMNPDVCWIGQNPVEQLLSAWRSDMSALLMTIDEGDMVETDFDLADGILKRRGQFRYTGLQMIRTDWLKDINEDVFSLNVYWDLLIERGGIHGLVYPGKCLDIGTSEGLAAANELLGK